MFHLQFFLNFWSAKPRIQIGIQPKLLDPEPESMNPDPKHWGTVPMVDTYAKEI
jgi:hypothetical protein